MLKFCLFDYRILLRPKLRRTGDARMRDAFCKDVYRASLRAKKIIDKRGGGTICPKCKLRLSKLTWINLKMFIYRMYRFRVQVREPIIFRQFDLGYLSPRVHALYP